jgi:hypothetical protein
MIALFSNLLTYAEGFCNPAEHLRTVDVILSEWEINLFCDKLAASRDMFRVVGNVNRYNVN